MEKIISILITIALSAPTALFGEEPNGSRWERMDQSGRTLLVTGYISGFRLGTVHGADFAVETSSRYLKELSNSSVYGVKIFKEYWKCGATIDKNRGAILDASARYGRKSLERPVEYYIEDVSSFYRKYPACRGRELMEMLREISLVWLEIRTYEDIGKECPHE